MASPLATFRKYDKVLLAIFGVLLMFAFLIGDPLSMMARSGPSGGPAGVAVSYKGGSLTDQQLALMIQADRAAGEMLQQVYFKTIEKEKQPRPFPWPSQANSEAGLVNNRLLAQKAHELGMSLSDEDIDSLLREMSNDTLSNNDLKKIRQDVLKQWHGSQIQVSEKDLYSQLRVNILAQQMIAILRNNASPQSGQNELLNLLSQTEPTMAITPAQAWDYYRRVNRQVEVELMPLPVEKYLDKVKTEPTLAQKKDLFEKYKDNVPLPYSAEPGFASPQKLAFSYVQINFAKYLEEAKASISEEQIREEYENRKEKGDLNVPVLPEDKKEDDKPPTDETKKDGSKPDGEAKPEETKSDDAKPSEEPKEKPADEPPPAGKPEESKPEEGTSENPEDELTDESSTGEEGAPPEASEEKPAEEKPTENKEAKPAEENKPAESDDEKKPADETKPEEGSSKGKPPEPKKPETRVRTFEEAKEEIVSSLAQKPAEDKRKEATEKVVEIVKVYAAKYREWEFEKQTATKTKKEVPPQPEIEPMLRDTLKKYDLTFKQLGLMDRFEIAEEELGQTSTFIPQFRQFVQFPELVYGGGFPLLEPQQIRGQTDTHFVFWATEEKPYKPAETREAVDEQIVRAFKLQEAFKLAKAEAEDLAKQAKDTENLHKAFPSGVENAGAIVETAPFTWLTTGGMPFGLAPLQVSEIPQVPYAGEEFMQSVLDLKAGEVGVAADQSHKTVYVVRVISQTPDEDVLRERFLQRGLIDPNIAMQYASARDEQYQTWMSNLQKEFELNWRRTPQQFDRQ